MTRTFLQMLLNRLHGHNFTVRFWDGEAISYGKVPPDFSIHFVHKPDFRHFYNSPELFLGEAYANGHLELNGSYPAMAAALADLDKLNPGPARLSGRIQALLASCRTFWRRFSGTEKHPSLIPAVQTSGQSAALPEAAPASAPESSAARPLSSGLARRPAANQEEQIAKSRREAHDVRAHYDLGNDFFSLWLDTGMTYSCAYFKGENDSLDKAQEQKIDLVLKKLDLRPGMTLLDTGCGWGALAMRAADAYGARVSAITLSREQARRVRELAARNNLDDNVRTRLCGYADLPVTESYDRIVSVGMLEHVGRKRLRAYISAMHALLKHGGVFLLHSITRRQEQATGSWINRYIFPGGYIPSLREIISLMGEMNYHVLHVESLRRHYVRTLDRWHDNFMAARDDLLKQYDERFLRAWSLYLRFSSAFLYAGALDVHQIVVSKGTNNALPMTMSSVYS